MTWLSNIFAAIGAWFLGYLKAMSDAKQRELAARNEELEKILRANINASLYSNDQLADRLSKLTREGKGPTVLGREGRAYRADSETTGGPE